MAALATPPAPGPARQPVRDDAGRERLIGPAPAVRRRRPGALAAGALALIVVSYGAGYATAQPGVLHIGGLPAASGSAARGAFGAQARDQRVPEDVATQFDAFWEAWDFVNKDYYRQPVDRVRLIQGAIKGMVAATNDQYAAYMDPASARIEKANLDGTIEGIGLTVEMKAGRHTIIAPVEDSPAAKAGLKSGDLLLKIDGKDIGSLSLAEAVALVRGPAGTKVKLTIQRADDPDGQPVEMELTRARIEIETVSGKVVADGIGYVRIRLFGTQTVPQLTRVLRDMRSRRVRGLVVDVRDNPGGYLSSAVEATSQFLKEGSIVVYEVRDGTRQQMLARPGGLATDLTLAVLVNRGSASGAEIMAGALRDYNRAVLIGETTFGKGSVQLPKDLSDGSSVRVTVGTWLTPGAKQIQGQGLRPDVEAKPTPDDERAKHDVALDKALEWFKAVPLPETAVTG